MATPAGKPRPQPVPEPEPAPSRSAFVARAVSEHSRDSAECHCGWTGEGPVGSVETLLRQHAADAPACARPYIYRKTEREDGGTHARWHYAVYS